MSQDNVRLLVCAQSVQISLRVRATLQGYPGMRVFDVQTARLALDKLKVGRFQALITAVTLPDLDGWRLARVVASQRFSKEKTEIIVVYDKREYDELMRFYSVAQIHPVSLEDLHTLPALLPTIVEDKPKVLLIEDDQPSTKMVCGALEDRYSIEAAVDGRSGINCYRRCRHEIVILDLGLPDLGGDEVLHNILDIDPQQPVLILTGNTELETHVAMSMQGAFDFRPKPVDIYELRRLCAEAMEVRKREDILTTSLPLGDELREHRLRIRAALMCNLRGKNQAATQHLKHAIHTAGLSPLSEEEWNSVKSEF